MNPHLHMKSFGLSVRTLEVRMTGDWAHIGGIWLTQA